MTSFFNMLNEITDVITNAVLNGMIRLQEPMVELLVVLAIIGIASNWEMYFASESWNWGNLFVKTIHIGFYAFLIRNWKMLLLTVKKTGEQLGIAAGGETGLLTPNDIFNLGVNKVFAAMCKLLEKLPFSMEALIRILAVVILAFALYSFFKIACTLFFTYAEFMIVGGLSMVLLPWSMTKWTKGIADKAWGILLTGAVKIMVCTFMVSLVSGFIEISFGNIDPKNPEIPNLLLNTISLLFLAFLVGKSVEYAGAMTNGLTVSTPDMMGATVGRATSYATGRMGGAIGNVAGRVVGSGARRTKGAIVNAAKRGGEWWLKYGGGIPL